MKKCAKKNAYTLTQVLITMLIIGGILVVTVLGIKIFDPNRLELRVLGRKMDGYIQQAMLLFMHNDVMFDDMYAIRYERDEISIANEESHAKIVKILQKYLFGIDFEFDYTNKYFSNTIKDYNWQDTGIKLNEAYSNFFLVGDGMIMGFRFYPDCKSTEQNAHTFNEKGKFALNNVCGSIFYDVNGDKYPNKLGSDQYIIPFNERGIKINDD